VGTAKGPLCLYAIVPEGDARAACARIAGLGEVACGPVAALVGKRWNEAAPGAALRHDRIVSRIVDSCSSVVPFRFEVDVRSELALHDVLEANLELLGRQLVRFRGRVEMGLKVKLSVVPAAERMSAGLEPVRALAPRIEDRRERLLSSATGQVFDGCYLVPSDDIEEFWSAVKEVRLLFARSPMLGSGPWAAYSFCDFPLRAAPVGTRRAAEPMSVR